MMAGARGSRDEPDPGHFERFCHVAVPDLLTEVCHVSTERAVRIGDDIAVRAESYAMLDDTSRDVLIAPFAEEIARYEPAGSSLMLKGAVAVVVRSSLLEEAHAHGPVEAGGIRGITTLAAAPLSHFLAARRRNPVTAEHNLFADLADALLPDVQDERGGVIAGKRVHDVNGPARRSRAGLVFRVSR